MLLNRNLKMPAWHTWFLMTIKNSVQQLILLKQPLKPWYCNFVAAKTPEARGCLDEASNKDNYSNKREQREPKLLSFLKACPGSIETQGRSLGRPQAWT